MAIDFLFLALVLLQKRGANIPRWLVNFYEKAAFDFNSINRQVTKVNDNRLNKGETDLNGMTAAVVNAAYVLITFDKRIIISKR